MLTLALQVILASV